MFEHIILAAEIAHPLPELIRRQHPRARLVVWPRQGLDPVALHCAAEMAATVVVEDSLVESVQGLLRGSFQKLSSWDARLATAVKKYRRCDEPDSVADGEGSFGVAGRPVVFCPTNDTHVRMFEPVARQLGSAVFLLFHQRPVEQAERTASELGVDYRIGGPEHLKDLDPSVVVFGNDWHEKAHRLMEAAHALGVPTVCLQEGCLDFETRRRMQWCDYPFLQGAIVLQHLEQQLYFLTGNPRFDSLKPCPVPRSPVVLINSNFTYNIHEEQREAWVGQVAAACQCLGVEFFISQHPRDTGQFPTLPVRRSGAGVVHQHLRDCSVVVTRFSTIVYEAMLLGRRVVYYNPHGESMRLFNEDRTGGIYRAYNPEDLVVGLKQAFRPTDTAQEASVEHFLDLHCGARDGLAARRCAFALSCVARHGRPRRERWAFLKGLAHRARRAGRRLGLGRLRRRLAGGWPGAQGKIR